MIPRRSQWLWPWLWLGALSVPAQAPTPAPPAAPGTLRAEDLLARYARLERSARSDLVRNLERRLARENVDVLQSIQGRVQGAAAYGARSGVRWFEPREFAPSATPRSLVAAGHERHRRFCAKMQPFVLVPDLRRAVDYDWLAGAAVRTTELDEDARIHDLAHGYAPGSDHALAQVLAALDRSPAQRRLGDYFEHLYGDRDGAVFAGVTLYDAFRSQQKLEMPDTDTIAYARLVLDTRAYESPIPGDRRRERLYQKIAAGFAAHHEHRTWCLAVAATFVRADPVLDPTWQALADRGHWLWQSKGRDLRAVAAWMQGFPGRSEAIAAIDAEMAKDDTPARQHREALRELAEFLRQCLAPELRAAGV